MATPRDWAAQGMAAGTPFALAHTFGQTGPFRPSTLPRRGPENVVLAGSSVQPGVGVPMVLISGRLAAERITGPCHDDRRRRRTRRAAGELAAAYRHCAAINARHGKSYHLATRLLTPDRRPAVHALYAAARTADDLVDVPGADPAGDLADWSRAVLAELERGWSDDPVRLALVHTYRRYDIPRRAPRRLPRRDDQRPRRHRLRRPRRARPVHVGLGVGDRAAGAAGARAPRPGVRREEAAPHAIALGEAFQLTNFLRDVGEDVDRGRVYLPADLMAAHGVTREQLAEKRHDARFRGADAGDGRRRPPALRRRRPGHADAGAGVPRLRAGGHRPLRRHPRARSSGPTTGCSTGGCRCPSRAAWRCSPAG